MTISKKRRYKLYRGGGLKSLKHFKIKSKYIPSPSIVHPLPIVIEDNDINNDSPQHEQLTSYPLALPSNKINKIINKYNTTQKQLVFFLKTICSDAGVCIAFGIEEEIIKRFFKNFIQFQFLTTIKKYNKISGNGFIYELQYTRRNYNSYAIMKYNSYEGGDNIIYEFIVGLFINKLCKVVPCFIETYGLYKVNKNTHTILKYNAINTSNKTEINVFKRSMTFITLNQIKQQQFIKQTCNSFYYSILIQHINNANTLKNVIYQNLNNLLLFSNNYLIYILFQIYYVLSRYMHIFTHYDLSLENVLLYIPKQNNYIQYYYHCSDGTIIDFKSHYLVKIIDYARSYFDYQTDNLAFEYDTQNSSVLHKAYEKLCSPLKDNGMNFIGLKINNTSDTYLLKLITKEMHINLIMEPEEIRQLLLKDLLIDDISTSKPAKTVRVVYDKLKDILMQEMVKINNNTLYLSEDWSKLGDLHIYAEETPMSFIPYTHLDASIPHSSV